LAPAATGWRIRPCAQARSREAVPRPSRSTRRQHAPCVAFRRRALSTGVAAARCRRLPAGAAGSCE
jgi:hypothetical protein